jgi:hypothetical protein
MIATNLNGSRSTFRVLKDNEPFFAAQHEQALAGARTLADVMLDRIKRISSFIEASRALPSPHLARAERLGAEAAAILVDILATPAETIVRDSKVNGRSDPPKSREHSFSASLFGVARVG